MEQTQGWEPNTQAQAQVPEVKEVTQAKGTSKGSKNIQYDYRKW